MVVVQELCNYPALAVCCRSLLLLLLISLLLVVVVIVEFLEVVDVDVVVEAGIFVVVVTGTGRGSGDPSLVPSCLERTVKYFFSVTKCNFCTFVTKLRKRICFHL